MRRTALTALVSLFTISPFDIASAQEADRSSGAEPLAVFLDCNDHICDFDHFRREIAWVNWVRDRQDADLHLLVTSQETGGGGDLFTLDYLGRGRFDGIEKRLEYVSDPNDTDPEVREGLTRIMALGLVAFVDTTAVAPHLRVVFDEPATPLAAPSVADPWNLWVFRTEVNGSIEGEAQQRSYSFEGSAEAHRVAEDFKIGIEIGGEHGYEEFDLDEGGTVSNTSEDYSAEVLAVWSLNAHWSAGGTAEANHSTFLNRDLAVFGGPAVELNVFPYSESTRRALTFRYALELASFDYELPTVEGKTRELLPRHSLVAAAAVQQPWGEIYGEVEGIQYLNDLAVHRINAFLRVEYRLFRGLELDVFGEGSRIKDQFYLPAEDLSPEEILLRRRQRETDFRFDVGIGFSYRFGSKLANIVNPRFD